MNKQQLTLTALLFSATVYGQTYSPIAASGYNMDVIAETSPAIGATTGVLDGSDYVLYSVGYGNVFATGTGLPDNGLITSGARTYQLQPFGQDNAVVLSTGGTDSLELVTPASYASVSLLGFATEGNGTMLFVLKFTDGSGTVYSNQPIPDWFFNPGAIVSGFDRTGRVTDTPDFQTDEPRMYAVDLALSCEDQAKLLEEILIINITPSPTINTAIFAVSGAAPLTAGAVTVTDVSCNGGADGTASLASTGGAQPLSYTWSTTPAQTTQQATGLAAGTYTVIVADASGCNADTLTATIEEPAPLFGGQFFSICEGESVQVGTNVYTDPGVYTDILTAANGCDSTVTTTIEVNSVHATISLMPGNTFMTEVEDATYQWVNCDSNYAEIPGATEQSFVAQTTGNYAVVVTKDGCTDTSECGNILIVSIDEFETQPVHVYPNPVTDQLTIQSPVAIEKAEIVDLAGKAHPAVIVNDRIDMRMLAPGTYLVRFTTTTGSVTVTRVVKE